ncbi:MAG TPA: fibronectin type III domain-containing protein [Gemmatimonadaceae bacterium]|nr:fibronectin type III domain-containing protein [Gemmatimonadaceae bacterium]
MAYLSRLTKRLALTWAPVAALAVFAACASDETPTSARPLDFAARRRPPSTTAPGTVTDLRVSAVTDSSATLTFKQVTDGAGKPASYDIRFSLAPISWGGATRVASGTCASPLAGTSVGANLVCTVQGLAAAKVYNFQLVAFRGTLGAGAVFGALSNVAVGTTIARDSVPGDTITPPPPPPPANVLFTEDFENASFTSRGWYDATNVLVSTTEHIAGSNASAQFRFLPGQQQPTSGGAFRHKFTASSSMYVSFYVKYSTNWVGSGKPYQPHEFHAISNLDGDWGGLSNNYMTLYLEHSYQNGGRPLMAMQDNKSINTSMGAVPNNLVNVTENRSTAGCNGVIEQNVSTSCFALAPWYNFKQVMGPVVFQPNPGAGYKANWNRVEAFFKLNSIVNGRGVADGVMQYWFNGQLIIDRHDILFRTAARADLLLNQFIIAPYFSDGSPVDQSMFIDNLVVATAR